MKGGHESFMIAGSHQDSRLAAEQDEHRLARFAFLQHLLTSSEMQQPGAGQQFVRLLVVEELQQGLLARSEEHTSELQSRQYLVCRLLLEKKKNRRRPSQ